MLTLYQYAIAVEMERNTQDRITWRIACKSEYFDEHSAESLLNTLDNTLDHVLNYPESQVISEHSEGITIANSQPIQIGQRSVYNGSEVDLRDISTKITEGLPKGIGAQVSVLDEAGNKSLVAFLTGEHAPSVVEKAVKNAKTRLPHHSIPDYIIPLNYEIGKVDNMEDLFNKIPAEEAQRYCLRQKTGDWSELEQRLRTIISRVSGLPEEEIQRTQTIFHLGLDSISAIQLSADFRKAEINLGVAQILRDATIERMALSVGKEKSADPSMDTNVILKNSLQNIDLSAISSHFDDYQVETVLPTTAGQVYMLSAWKASNYELFMPTFTFRMEPLDVDRLQSAWKAVVQQEAILRTAFRPTTSSDMPFVQIVLRNPPMQFKSHVVSHPVGGLFLSFMMKDEDERPADMGLPPVRLTAIITPMETVILLTIHHALYDGVSLPLLLNKIQKQLDAPPGDRLPTPDPDESKFTDFVAYVHSQDRSQQRRFWSSYLRNAESTVLSRRISNSLVALRSSVFLPAVYPNVTALDQRLRAHGISLQSVFLAAFAKHYHASLQSTRKDLTIAVYLSNRHFSISELQNMTAPTLNILPIRIRDVRSLSILQLAKQVQKDLIELSQPANACIGLWDIEEWTGVTVDCAFNFLRLPGSAKDNDNSEEEDVSKSTGTVLKEVKVDRLDTVRKVDREPKRWDIDPKIEERLRNIRVSHRSLLRTIDE